MWDSRPLRPLLLGPAMTGTSSLVSPVIRAKAQHWTSKSQGRPGKVQRRWAGPCRRRVRGSRAAPDHAVPAPPRDEALELLRASPSFLFYLRTLPFPQHAVTSGEGKTEAMEMGGSQVGLCVQIWPPPPWGLTPCALSPPPLTFAFFSKAPS